MDLHKKKKICTAPWYIVWNIVYLQEMKEEFPSKSFFYIYIIDIVILPLHFNELSELGLEIERHSHILPSFGLTRHSDIKDAQISAGCRCCRDSLGIYHKLGLIFHMQKGLRWTPYNRKERSWSAWLYIPPPSPLNYLLKLLKWLAMQTYKLLITGTMIAYYSVGMPELCINHDFFVSVWGPFPRLAEWEA